MNIHVNTHLGTALFWGKGDDTKVVLAKCGPCTHHSASVTAGGWGGQMCQYLGVSPDASESKCVQNVCSKKLKHHRSIQTYFHQSPITLLPSFIQ